MTKYKLTAAQVVGQSRKYKNYQEKYKLGTRAQMWDFHWCPGSSNYTIWAMLYEDYTRRNYQKQAWCAMFVSDIVVLALVECCNMSLTDAIPAAKDLCGGDLPYNCQSFVNSHKGDTRLNHSPKIGSFVLFHTGNKYGHIGICTGVDGNRKGFTSCEGNTSGGADKVIPDGGAVCEKWHSLSSTTLFWHPEYNISTTVVDKPIKVQTGEKGLRVTASSLNIRTSPNGAISNRGKSAYNSGTYVFPYEKQFVDGKAWYRTNDGWISASYLSGWVLEQNGQWWYLKEGYIFDVNSWFLIDNVWYYAMNTGYIATSVWIQYKGNDYYCTSDGSMGRNAYVKSLDKELYYWLNNDGVWEPQWNTVAPNIEKYSIIL